MTILLYNDGRLVIDDGNPIEGNSLEGLVACVSDPQSGDTLKFDGKQWVAGAAASGLPDVSGDDDGKVLTVVDGAWAPAAAGGGGGSNIYMFTTSYDEVHDRAYINATCAELRAAAEAGKYMLCVDTLDSGGEFDYFVYFVGTMTVHTSEPYSFSLTLYSPDGAYYSYVGNSPTENPYQYKDD